MKENKNENEQENKSEKAHENKSETKTITWMGMELTRNQIVQY